ncbi:MAG TPA: TIGR03086 family metal-binding protein [Iamia sp.]|nr:TIGR03086 family metal-binding protein [Iamia sp.]
MTAAFIPPAAETFTSIVEGIDDDQLAGPTPCPDYDVAGLIGHLLHYGPSLVGAGTREPAPPGEARPADPATWRADLLAQTDRLATAWSRPEAWEGETRMVGPDPMPASMIGGIALAELVVHGWDLARATGQAPTWPADLLDHVHQQLVGMAEMGRQMGAFGPEVAVPADAPTLDRLLGVAGRDPAWTP